jgi:hypothetical protein
MFEVLTPVNILIVVFGVVMSCNLEEVYQCFGETYSLQDAAGSSETLVTHRKLHDDTVQKIEFLS